MNIPDKWILAPVLKECYDEIMVGVNERRIQFDGLANIYPPNGQVLNAFKFFNPEECRVIIIGQDPYHGDGQAMGLSFSVPDGVKIPPSLRNIFKEICQDVGDLDKPTNGDLTYLAQQGVLLLNRALTVTQAKPNSHCNMWQGWTKLMFAQLLEKSNNIVIMLWGNDAKRILTGIPTEILEKHLILKATHPSPLSANRGGWFGSNHFSKANAYLEQHGYPKINWLNHL
jgi:uracil-DNA glycosylase